MKATNIIKTALIFGLTCSTVLTKANDTRPVRTTVPPAEKSISSKFKFPTLLIPFNDSHANTPLKVEVIFTTNKDGKVTYAYAKTRNLQLKQEIEKQFSLFKLTSLKENVAHSVMLNFKYIEG